MINCTYENGSQTCLRHVVTGALIIKDDKILLEKRGTYKGKPISEYGKWAMIGGYLDLNENLEQGLKREVLEETGFEINNLILFHINDKPNRRHEDRQNVAINFIATPTKEKIVINEEVMELKWFNLNNLPKKGDMAFDHLDEIELYKKYLKEKFNLPIIG